VPIALVFGCKPGRFKILFSGTEMGGAVSLNTLRPVPSTHCHWAITELQAKPVKKPNTQCRHGMEKKILYPIGEV
jgi:hypothetical protein